MNHDHPSNSIMVLYIDPSVIIMIRILNIVGLVLGTSAAAQQLQDICIHQFAKARFWENFCLKISHMFTKSGLRRKCSILLHNYNTMKLALNWDKLTICSFRGKVVCLQSSLQGNLYK